MYLDYVVDIPDVKGKITFRTKGQARYVIMSTAVSTIRPNSIQM